MMGKHGVSVCLHTCVCVCVPHHTQHNQIGPIKSFGSGEHAQYD